MERRYHQTQMMMIQEPPAGQLAAKVAAKVVWAADLVLLILALLAKMGF